MFASVTIAPLLQVIDPRLSGTRDIVQSAWFNLILQLQPFSLWLNIRLRRLNSEKKCRGRRITLHGTQIIWVARRRAPILWRTSSAPGLCTLLVEERRELLRWSTRGAMQVESGFFIDASEA